MWWSKEKKPKHEHKWKVFNVSFTQPIDLSINDFEVRGHNAIEKMNNFINTNKTGQTHFYLKCLECGDINYRTVPGIVPRKEKGQIESTEVENVSSS